jgi:hypothetical protein
MMALQGGSEAAANARQRSISVYLIFVVTLVDIIDGNDIITKTISSNGAMDIRDASLVGFKATFIFELA